MALFSQNRVLRMRSGTVSVIDLESASLVKTIATGNVPEGLDVSPDGRELWVANHPRFGLVGRRGVGRDQNSRGRRVCSRIVGLRRSRDVVTANKKQTSVAGLRRFSRRRTIGATRRCCGSSSDRPVKPVHFPL